MQRRVDPPADRPPRGLWPMRPGKNRLMELLMQYIEAQRARRAPPAEGRQRDPDDLPGDRPPPQVSISEPEVALRMERDQ